MLQSQSTIFRDRQPEARRQLEEPLRVHNNVYRLWSRCRGGSWTCAGIICTPVFQEAGLEAAAEELIFHRLLHVVPDSER